MGAMVFRRVRRLFVPTGIMVVLFFLGMGLFRYSATAADSYSFKIGGIECISLSDGFFEGPPQLLAPEIPQDELAAFLTSCGAPPDTVVTPLSCLVVQIAESGRTVLIDTGMGTWSDAPTAGKLLESFKKAGLDPEEVDYVLISHLHQDHVNGAFDKDGIPVFPNAEYYVSQEEVDFWQNPGTDLGGTLMPVPFRKSVLDDAQRFLTLSGSKLHTFPAGEDAIPGVKTIPFPGHTPGQVGFLIQSQEETLLYVADSEANPLVSLQKPNWRFQNDEDTKAAAATRKILSSLMLNTGWNIFAPHFPGGGVGRLEKKSGKITFTPRIKDVTVNQQSPMSAKNLYDEFNRNRPEAQSADIGKNFAVTGVVVYTGPDVHNTPSIELSDAVGGKRYVLCVVNSFDQLAGVSIGDSVTMSGNFHIYVPDTWGVVLKQSEFIK